MKVKAISSFISSTYGDIQSGQEFECAADLASQWDSAGMVKIIKSTYDTKVIRETPEVGEIPLASGPVNESSSSPVAPASQKKTRRSSKAKKQSS